MRQLPIDLDELVECMQQHFDEAGPYLDKQTGEIELVDESFVRQIEDGEEDEGAEFDGPDWEKELLPIAQAVAAIRWARCGPAGLTALRIRRAGTWSQTRSPIPAARLPAIALRS